MKGISLSTLIILIAIISVTLAGSTYFIPKKPKLNVTSTTTTIYTVPLTTTQATTSISTSSSTSTIPQTTTTSGTQTQGGNSTSTSTSTTVVETENCCNEIDDDGDGLENGADPDCQQDIDLKAGWNPICWATELLNYNNERDYYSGWWKCPEGYIAKYVNVFFLSTENEVYLLPLEREDCLISYNKYNQTRREICGFAEDQPDMNCTIGYVDYVTGEASPVHLCIHDTGNPKSSWVRLRFKSDSSKTATGLMVEGVYCAKEEEFKTKEASEIKLIVSNTTITTGTYINITATLNVSDQTFFLERDDNLIASGKNKISVFEPLNTIGTYNYTAYWPGNENYTGDSKSVFVNVIPGEEKVCSGSVSLSLNPTQANVGSTVIATVSGLSNCDGYNASIRRDSCEGIEVCECVISGSGCSCEFNISQEGNYTYFACVDVNANDRFETGEYDSKNLTVISTIPAITQCNSDGTNISGLCDVECGASLNCKGHHPGDAWCQDNVKMSCNLTCQFSKEDCSPYTCSMNECKKSCSSNEDCASGYVCDDDDSRCKSCDSNHKEIGGDSPDGKCEWACGAAPECDEKSSEISWCDPNGVTRKSCDSTCKYSEEDCRNYGDNYVCSDGNCVETSEEPCKYTCACDCIPLKYTGTYKCKCPSGYEEVKGSCPDFGSFSCSKEREVCCKRIIPEVSIECSPKKSTYYTGDSIGIIVNATDDKGISHIGLEIWNEYEFSETKQEFFDCKGTTPCSHIFSIELNRTGYWQFIALANDTDGHYWENVSYPVYFFVQTSTTSPSTTTSITTTSSISTISSTTSSSTTSSTTTIPEKWTPLSLLNALIRFLTSLFRIK